MQNSNMVAEYIDHMGSDLSVVNSAKASFGKVDTEFKPKEHTRLINYLARGMTQAGFKELVESLENIPSHINGWQDREKFVENALEQYRHTPLHFSPFCHTAITLRLKAPIAIHAQMMKHTVGFAHNTTSRRYVSDTPELFVPEFRNKPIGNVKQGSGDTVKDNIYWQAIYSEQCTQALNLYDTMIKAGIAPEQARFVLPQGVMTEWVSTGSLYAWARLFNLRTDSHAQKEIQTLAHMIELIVEPLFPISWQALTRQLETNNG